MGSSPMLEVEENIEETEESTITLLILEIEVGNKIHLTCLLKE